MNPTHIPDGMMCFNCTHALRKCNHLPFTTMRIIGIDKHDKTKVVRCTDYEKRKEQP